MNPRVAIWLEAHGLTPADIARPSGADIPRVEVNGALNMWTFHFSAWIQAQWSAWAASLGFTHSRDGSPPHRVALLSGHTDAEFDAWLAENRGRHGS